MKRVDGPARARALLHLSCLCVRINVSKERTCFMVSVDVYVSVFTSSVRVIPLGGLRVGDKRVLDICLMPW